MEIPGGTAGELSVGLQGTDPRFARQLERSIYRRSDLSKLDARNASPYFRLYGPTEAYFDKSWPLPDLEEVK
jgi:hypothetical protein